MQDQQNGGFKGRFKRESMGNAVEPTTVTVERGKIRAFAEVLGYRDPIHHDVDIAKAQGHKDLVAPPSFYMALEALANDERKRRGQQTIIELAGCDFRYLLHGDEQYSYDGLIYAGDDLSLTTRVVDFYDKKGGAMEFAVFESTVTHPERGVLVTAKRTLLHRLG